MLPISHSSSVNSAAVVRLEQDLAQSDATSTVDNQLVLRSQPDALKRLFELIDQRLALMPAVAAWKYVNNCEVYDAKREERVLTASKLQAAKAGINPESYQVFVQLQMDMAKEIQMHLHKQWKENNESLQITQELPAIRQALIEIGEKMVNLIGLMLTENGRFDQRLLTQMAVQLSCVPSAHTRKQLVDTLAGVCLNGNIHRLLP